MKTKAQLSEHIGVEVTEEDYQTYITGKTPQERKFEEQSIALAYTSGKADVSQKQIYRSISEGYGIHIPSPSIASSSKSSSWSWVACIRAAFQEIRYVIRDMNSIRF